MSAKHCSHQPKWSICCTTCYCLQSKRKRTWGVLTPPPQSPTPQGCPESPSWIQVEVILVAGGLHASSLTPHQKSTHCCMLSYSDLVTSAATKIHVTFWVFVFSTLLYFICNVLWFFFNIHMIVCGHAIHWLMKHLVTFLDLLKWK